MPRALSHLVSWRFAHFRVNFSLTISTMGGGSNATHCVAEVGCTSRCKHIRNRLDPRQLRRRDTDGRRYRAADLWPVADDARQRQPLSPDPGLLRVQQRLAEPQLQALSG